MGPDDSTWKILKKGSSDQTTLQRDAKAAGLRASLVANPRAGCTIYTHSDQADTIGGGPCQFDASTQGYPTLLVKHHVTPPHFCSLAERPPLQQAFWLMLGIHPAQAQLEAEYQGMKARYVALRLAQRLEAADSVRRSPAALAAVEDLRQRAAAPKGASTDAAGWATAVELTLTSLGAQGFPKSALLKDAAAVGPQDPFPERL